MRATVLGITVASLWAAASLPGQETAAAMASAGQDTGRAADTAAAASVGTVDTLRFGGRTIAVGDTVAGPVLVVGGDLRVRGTIQGSAVAIAGDVIVEAGGRVTGDVIAALGHVRQQGGAIGGRARSFDREFSFGT
jgi:hypothetical protein